MKRVLFYGGASLLSNIWSRYWKNNFDVYIGLHKKWIEIEGIKSIQLSEEINDLGNLLKQYKIDIIVNCAGLTNVEECEKNTDLAHYLNGYLPGEIARIAYNTKVKLIHISTDHLFNGKEKKANEKCILQPINTYAKSKAIGDNVVLENNTSALVIRTNFFGNGPSYKLSFSDKIITALNKNEKIFLFNNVFYTPIHVHQLADCALELIERDSKGVYNICSNERISKFDFGIMIAEKLKKDKALIIPIEIEKKTDLTLRPKDMSLSNEKFKKEARMDIDPLIKQIYNL
jgi:dTDP-4-dehydrorhamnose reductase